MSDLPNVPPDATPAADASNQFALLTQRRFLPFFLTQTLNAFNDNVFKQAMIALMTFGAIGLSAKQSSIYPTLAHLLFILPFFLFSGISGQLSDKLDKAKIAVAVKLAEVLIMAIGAIGFIRADIHLLLAMLFMMGVHSAVFGPLKYGILPQVLREKELTGGNGLVEMATFLAILLGSIAGTSAITMVSLKDGSVLVATITIAMAVIGVLCAKAIPKVSAPAPGLQVDWNPISSTISNLKELRGNRTVLLSCLGISWFWYFASVYFSQLPSFAKDILGGGSTVYTLLLAVFSIGSAVGAIACERLSKHRIEIGLVPFGAIGMTVFGMLLYFAAPSASGNHDLTIGQFLQQAYALKVLLWLFLMAVFSGLFIVPLFALIQSRADPQKRSRIIAANNILNAAFMVCSGVASLLMLEYLHMSVPQILLVTAVLNLLVAMYIFTLVPEFLMRFCCWILINVMYRVRVNGLQKLPEEGAALLVSNHVSFIDWLILAGCIPRPAVFVMYYKFYEIPILNWLFKAARCIPIAGRGENPQMYEHAFAEMSRHLQAGELVCIFPEGGLTPDGNVQSFKRGVEIALERDPVPVVPMALTGLWGSLFSRWDKHNKKLKLPRRFMSRVQLNIGSSVAPAAANAAALEQAVRSLRGEIA
jgi:1-acyl-sn-glycerol-3-phosphate acyltransferase